MRRNLRLALALLFLAILVILQISRRLYNGTMTLQHRVYSVSRLTDNFSVFVPTSSKYRSLVVVRAADGKIPVNTNVHPKQARNFYATIGAVEHSNHYKRQRKQRFAKFAKRAKKDNGKTLSKRTKQSKLSRSAGSSEGLQHTSKTRVDKNFVGLVMTSPNHHNHQSTQTESNFQDQYRASNASLSNDRVIPNTEVSLSLQKQKASTFQNGSEKTRSTSKRSGVRVVIVAYGRSGSSFFGGIFNAHPDFFFIYEPLNHLKNVVNRESEEYINGVEYVINTIFNCDFEDNRFLDVMSHANLYRASSRPLVSPPFCNTDYQKAINFSANKNWKLCNGKIAANALNEICHQHANIASKILLERIEPIDLSWILSIVPSSSPTIQPSVPALKGPGNEVKPVYVLYLVRDPRAMIFSRHRLGWTVPRERNEFAFKSGEVDENVKKICDTIELNLGAVLRHPSRIKLVRYEELVKNPQEVVRNLFGELHISPSKKVFRWIYSKTHGPVDMSALSLSRNANASINDWRKNIPDKLLEITEMRCARVMKYLGYLSSNGSQEVLHDLRIPLYLNKIKDFKNYRLPTRMFM